MLIESMCEKEEKEEESIVLKRIRKFRDIGIMKKVNKEIRKKGRKNR